MSNTTPPARPPRPDGALIEGDPATSTDITIAAKFDDGTIEIAGFYISYDGSEWIDDRERYMRLSPEAFARLCEVAKGDPTP